MFEVDERSVAGHPLLRELATMRTAVAQAGSGSTLSMTRACAESAITEVHALKNSLEALYLSLLVAREETVPTVGAAHAHTAAWAADTLRLTRGQATRDVHAAFTLAGDLTPGSRGHRHAGRLPLIGAALTEGTISREHVDVAVRALAEVPTAMLKTRAADVDAVLTQHAATFCPQDTATVAAHLLSIIAPDGLGPADPADAHERRQAAVGTARDGTVRFTGRLDPAQGAEVTTVWDHLADPANFRDEHGNPLRLTRPQRYADAFAEVFRLAAAALSAEHPAAPGPRVSIITTEEQLTHTPTPTPTPGGASAPRDTGARDTATRGAAEHGATEQDTAEQDTAEQDTAEQGATEHGATAQQPAWCSAGRTAGYATCEATGVLSPATLHTLACDATLERVVLHRHGAVARLETLGRPATPAMRRALAARDGGCAFPGCTAPPSWTDAHHVRFWSRGGLTVIENMTLLCRRHHTVIHQERWTIEMVDGVPWFIPPATLDPHRTPRRNTVHTEIEHTRRIGQALLADQPLPTRPPPPDLPHHSIDADGDEDHGDEDHGDSDSDGTGHTQAPAR